MSPADPVRWGIISTANINRAVIPGAQASEITDLVGVASRDAARAEAYAHEHGIPRAYGSYEAMLEDPEIEAVYISLPNEGHVPWSVRALEAGKHVLCEKPLTRRPADAERAFDVAERAGRHLVEAFMWRHHPQTRRLSELVANGAVGELRMLRAVFSFMLRDDGDVRLSAELDGGALMDVGTYCVSGMRLLAGEPTVVSAEQVVGPSSVDVRFAGVLRFPGDVLGTLDCAFDVPPRDELEVIGTDATLFVDDPWHGRATGIELRRGGESELIEVEAADPYRLELEDLSRAIRGDGEPLLGRADAVGQARALEALYAAADAGRSVRL